MLHLKRRSFHVENKTVVMISVTAVHSLHVSCSLFIVNGISRILGEKHLQIIHLHLWSGHWMDSSLEIYYINPPAPRQGGWNINDKRILLEEMQKSRKKIGTKRRNNGKRGEKMWRIVQKKLRGGYCGKKGKKHKNNTVYL